MHWNFPEISLLGLAKNQAGKWDLGKIWAGKWDLYPPSGPSLENI